MRVLALTRYERLGASSRLRIYQYIPQLERCDIAVQVSPFLSDLYVRALYSGSRSKLPSIMNAYRRRLLALRSVRQFDMIWIEKEAAPWMPAWAERRIRRLGIPYMVDYDDAIFHTYDSHRAGLVRRTLGRKIDEVMQGAAIVVAGNEYLGSRARAAGAKRVEIIPTVIDLDRYPPTPAEPQKIFTVGWIGTPVTASYLRVAERGLAALCRGGGARVLAVGSGPIALEGVDLEVREWREETEVAEIRRVDAGIMPLPDAAWERGKCGYKLIQFMACGRPVVASPVGVNCQIVDHEANGLLASTPEEWETALKRLRDDPDFRLNLGSAARRKVEQRYALQVTAPRMAELFRECLQS